MRHVGYIRTIKQHMGIKAKKMRMKLTGVLNCMQKKVKDNKFPFDNSLIVTIITKRHVKIVSYQHKQVAYSSCECELNGNLRP